MGTGSNLQSHGFLLSFVEDTSDQDTHRLQRREVKSLATLTKQCQGEINAAERFWQGVA